MRRLCSYTKHIASLFGCPALVALLASAFLLTPGHADARKRTPRACVKATKLAKSLAGKVRALKRIAYHMKKTVRRGGKYYKLHKPARKLQRPIVSRYSSHFKQPTFLSKWTAYKLRKKDVRKSFRLLFFRFKGDWRKLRKGGYKNFNKIKSNGFKLPKKACLPHPHRNTAPCGNVQDLEDAYDLPSTCPKYNAKKFNKAFNKKFKALSKYFTKGKLKNISAIRTFLKFFSKQAIINSINKTKRAITEGRRTKALGKKFRRLKKEIERLQKRLKAGIKQCRRAKRRRTSIDRSPTKARKCGGDDTTAHAPVCWVCTSLGGVYNDVTNVLGGSLIGSFEGNFQTANDWCDTDEAYNTGAESAASAQNVPGL